MNRRNFIKAGVAATVALNVSPVAASPIKLSPVNRMERYKEYNEILERNYAVGNALADIAHDAAIAVPECGYVPLENGFKTSFAYLRLYRHAFDLAVFGDLFFELLHEDKLIAKQLPANTMYRIETIKGKLLEFQQAKEGPDYAALSRPIDNTSHAVRFRAGEIFQLSIGTNAFHPYGVSLLEPIRKNSAAMIGQGAIKNFHKIFVDGMVTLKELTDGNCDLLPSRVWMI